MSEFSGMEELLQDFLTEAGELLSDVDNKLVELEKRPGDTKLLNDIFRGFHTIKGGAGFLNVEELVKLCHKTENLFDKLRNNALTLTPALMDAIMDATGKVRDMFGDLERQKMPAAVNPALLESLQNAIDGKIIVAVAPADAVAAPAAVAPSTSAGEPDWQVLMDALLGKTSETPKTVVPSADPAPSPVHAVQDRTQGRRVSDGTNGEAVKSGRRENDKGAGAQPETTIRIDTVRLDQVLNLSGEIGLAKNRLNCLRTDLLSGKTDAETLRALDEAVGQLDLLVSDLQNAVMKTRMQPIGRLFQKYPRVARDMGRQLGKSVELVLSGEETELDKTMIEELSDPLIHLIRNAVDHGLESTEDRRAAGKPEGAKVYLSAQQIGDHILIEIKDDGRGIKPEVLRRKALEKGVLDAETAANLDDKASLNLIFLPGFSTKDQANNFSGRGVGMDVVRTNIQKLNGRIDITSVVGQGTTFAISIPLTLAILPVLVVRLGTQPFAVPLALVREIIPIRKEDVQEVSGRPTLLVRDEVLPIHTLAAMIGWERERAPAYGVLMQTTGSNFILGVDGFVGRDDVVIKPLDDIKPKGISGATLSGDGSIVLVLDMDALTAEPQRETRRQMFELAA